MSARKTPRRKDAGFTLIEVLAALLIFSLAIMGLTRTGMQSARAVAALEQKTWAGVIADNQLVIARTSELVKGRRTGEDEVMGRSYVYSVDTADTDTPNFFKITIDVRGKSQTGAADEGQVVVQRTGFRARKSAPVSVSVPNGENAPTETDTP